LAGSAAYALGETFGWHVGLSRKLSRARAFYAAIAGGGPAGRAAQQQPHRPDQGAVLERGDQRRGRRSGDGADDASLQPQGGHGRLQAARRPEGRGWVATAVMAAAAIGLFATWGK